MINHRTVCFVCFVCLLFAGTTANAQAKRKLFVPGQPAVVFNEELAALREQPEVKAPLKQRLSRGRVVGLVGGSVKTKSESQFVRVAISRNVRGWMLSAALARVGNVADAEKILAALAESREDIVKVRMARLCLDLKAVAIMPKALWALGQAAERASEKLSRDATRRLADQPLGGNLSKRDLLLSFDGLDRFNRAGVTFDYDAAKERLVYDGAAYRELVRRFPRSAEAAQASERLAQLSKP